MTIEYKKYLKSPQWAEIRNDLYANRGRHCEQCGSKKNIQIHHLNYERIFNEEPGDLIILCNKCHLISHNKLKLKQQQKQYNKKWRKKQKRRDRKLKAIRKLERRWCSKSWNQRQQQYSH